MDLGRVVAGLVGLEQHQGVLQLGPIGQPDQRDIVGGFLRHRHTAVLQQVDGVGHIDSRAAATQRRRSQS